MRRWWTPSRRVDPAASRPGVGLGSMRARIETLHGVFRIGANNPRGTLIEARLPREDRAAAAPP